MIERLGEFEVAHNSLKSLQLEMQTGLFGREEMARLMVASLVTGQHLLIEGMPGTGKTELAKNLTHAVDGLTFGRVQGAVDLQPADLVGMQVFNRKTNDFDTRKGPLTSTDIVLVDELNRLSPNTQGGGLFSTLAEGYAKVGDEEITLSRDLFVIGTQNPYERGTGVHRISNPLADRFGASIFVGIPSLEERKQVLRMHSQGRNLDTPRTVLDIKALEEAKNFVKRIKIEESAIDYIAEYYDLLMKHMDVEVLAAGHRGGISALDLSRAVAVMDGKSVVTKETVGKVIPFTGRHRISVDVDSSQLEVERNSILYDTSKKVA